MIEGKIESWVNTSTRELAAGDSVFIPKNTVHGSFNASREATRVLAILGPCVGSQGFESVDVSGDPPWNNLRS